MYRVQAFTYESFFCLEGQLRSKFQQEGILPSFIWEIRMWVLKMSMVFLANTRSLSPCLIPPSRRVARAHPDSRHKTYSNNVAIFTAAIFSGLFRLMAVFCSDPYCLKRDLMKWWVASSSEDKLDCFLEAVKTSESKADEFGGWVSRLFSFGLKRRNAVIRCVLCVDSFHSWLPSHFMKGIAKESIDSWMNGWRHMLPGQTAWVWSLDPAWWGERTDFHSCPLVSTCAHWYRETPLPTKRM